MDKIYVIGHRSPDLDSAAAAIAYANFKNQTEGTAAYVPALAGPMNKVTAFVLAKFGLAAPEILSDASGSDLVLVDHNEESQQVAGEDKNIIEILDHHKVNFAGPVPIRIDIRPLGSSNSIIYDKYKQAGLKIGSDLAGLMLAAVLDDTVITKSPTTTADDKQAIAELSALAGISAWQEFGIEMFKAKSDLGAMSEAEMIKLDFKDFPMKAGLFGIGQLETVDLSLFAGREEQLIEELNSLRQTGGYHSCILFITDILKEGSQFLVSSSEPEKIEKAFNVKLENNRVYIDGIISRKKQVAPQLISVFDK